MMVETMYVVDIFLCGLLMWVGFYEGLAKFLINENIFAGRLRQPFLVMIAYKLSAIIRHTLIIYGNTVFYYTATFAISGAAVF